MAISSHYISFHAEKVLLFFCFFFKSFFIPHILFLWQLSKFQNEIEKHQNLNSLKVFQFPYWFFSIYNQQCQRGYINKLISSVSIWQSTWYVQGILPGVSLFLFSLMYSEKN